MTPRRSPQALLAEDLARSGRIAPAVEACYEALSRDADDPVVHTLLAHLLLDGDFYDEAIAAATKAIELDPGCSPAYLALGLAYDRRGGMWDQSVLVWHELAEVVPDLVTAHVQLGEAFSAAAFDEEAIESWQQALVLDPTEARAIYDLAIAALKREGMATALPGFRKAGELDPSQDDLFFALLGIRERPAAPPDLSAVPADRASRLSAAALAARAEDLFGAAELVRLVLDEAPDDAGALSLAAYVYLKQQATNEALACAARALALAPGRAEALYTLGVVYTRRFGLARHAARAFAALAKAAPREALAHVLLGESLLGLQRYGAAKRTFETAVRLDPACVRARFGLAAVSIVEGSHALAEWHVRRAAYYDTRRQGLFWRLFDAYVTEVDA